MYIYIVTQELDRGGYDDTEILRCFRWLEAAINFASAQAARYKGNVTQSRSHNSIVISVDDPLGVQEAEFVIKAYPVD